MTKREFKQGDAVFLTHPDSLAHAVLTKVDKVYKTGRFILECDIHKKQYRANGRAAGNHRMWDTKLVRHATDELIEKVSEAKSVYRDKVTALRMVGRLDDARSTGDRSLDKKIIKVLSENFPELKS